MQSIWLAQPNYLFGRNAFLPYSAARLWSYARPRNWELTKLLPFRLPIDEALRGDAPDLIGFSCYIWNWRYNMQLARAAKERWPNVVIVCGGPQIPNKTEGFFDTYPWVDLLIHGEGETAFHKALDLDFSKVPGASYAKGGETVTTGPNNRLLDLDSLPSPYLDGTLDELVSDRRYNWHALQETNRGCPYQCTFCDWGSATFSTVRQFPLPQLLTEIEWFAEHKIELLYNCDANFGMLPRDVDIARKLIATKRSTGWPQKFRAAYAKKTTDKVFEVGALLAGAEMSKGVTLSAQSMSKDVCKIIKRRPIVETEYSDLLRRYSARGVTTYTEIILGLPGETAESFRAGLIRLIELGQHDGINVYPLIMLTNSEMRDPDYCSTHGLQIKTLPMLLLHGSPVGDAETYDLVIGTNAMPHEDWIESIIYAWLVQGLHCLGLTRPNGDYRAYYDRLMLVSKDTVLGAALASMRWMLAEVLDGTGTWNIPEPRFGEITWPPEERLFLRCVVELDRFCAELDIPYPDIVRPEGDLETWAREIVWYGRKGKLRKAA